MPELYQLVPAKEAGACNQLARRVALTKWAINPVVPNMSIATFMVAFFSLMAK